MQAVFLIQWENVTVINGTPQILKNCTEFKQDCRNLFLNKCNLIYYIYIPLRFVALLLIEG